jgi:hypothetical protein
MKTTDKDIGSLILAAFRAGSSLGRAMAENEAYQYIADLRERLGASLSQLDLSIKSLVMLEDLLSTHLPGFLGSNEKTGDDILCFFRETAAYIGLTFVRNSPAEWVLTSESLFNNYIQYRYTTTGQELPDTRYVTYTLFSLASYCWQQCIRGQQANLAAIVTREKRRRPRARQAGQ